MDKEALYLRLPIFAQNWACSLEGGRIQRSRYGKGFPEKLAWYEKNAPLHAEELCAIRDARLISFLKHAYRTVPYYNRLFASLRLREKDLDNADVIKELPILEKKQVQGNPQDFLSVAVPRSQRIMTHTSGTTGAGLKFATTLEAQQEQWAVWWRYRRAHGIERGTWCGYFGGRSVVPVEKEAPPFWRFNWPGKQVIFSAYHMKQQNLRHYLKALEKFRPKWLHGYPSTLALLASYINEMEISIGYPIRWITIGAESLLEHQRIAIFKAFGVNPIQHYGSAEAVANISQSVDGNLYVDEDFSFVEFIPNNDSTYRVIGTNFTNMATPLIRYDTGDNVILEKQKTSFSRDKRKVNNIDGRIEDYVVLKDSTRLGRMDHIFKDMINIKEAQLFQKVPGELLVKVVRGERYGVYDEKAILQEFYKRTGDRLTLLIEYVDSIEKTKNGKLRFVVRDKLS